MVSDFLSRTALASASGSGPSEDARGGEDVPAGIEVAVPDGERKRAALHTHRPRFRHHEAAEHVLQQGLIDREGGPAAGGEVSLGKVRPDELLCQVQCHRAASLRSCAPA